MKKSIAILMTASVMMHAAAFSASACCPRDLVDAREIVHVTASYVSLEDGKDMDGVYVMYDEDKDGSVTTMDILAGLNYNYVGSAVNDFNYSIIHSSIVASGNLKGYPGAYLTYITTDEGNAGDLDPAHPVSNYHFDNMWSWLHIFPYIPNQDTYVLEWNGWNGNDVVQNSEISLRAVCYRAGSNVPVPVEDAIIVMDGVQTNYLTEHDGTVKVQTYLAGQHTISAYFPTKPADADQSDAFVYNVVSAQNYLSGNTDPAETLPAVTTTTTAAVTTTAATTDLAFASTSSTTAATAVTSASAVTSTTASASTSASSAAAATTTTAAAVRKPAASSGTQKVGSLKTGDSTPIAALLLAGFAAAGSAVALNRKPRKH